MTYNEIQEWISANLDINNYETFDDLVTEIQNLFGLNYDLSQDFAQEFWEDRIETFDDYVQEITEPLFEKIYSDIDKIMEEPLTKREQTVQVLETAEIPFTIKEFVEATGMNPNTARRELGQGVKKGLFKRVSRGTYEQL